MHFVQFIHAILVSRKVYPSRSRTALPRRAVLLYLGQGRHRRGERPKGMLRTPVRFRAAPPETLGGCVFMARRPRKACAHPGCPALVEAGQTYCDKHRRESYKRFDEGRGTAAQRGYGSRWAWYAADFKRGHPLCRECEAQGIVTPTYVVDHIEPVKGAGDPLFWEPSNHQPLCERCHNVKRATEDKETWRQRRENDNSQSTD